MFSLLLPLTGLFFFLDQITKVWAEGVIFSEPEGVIDIYVTYNESGLLGLFPAFPGLGLIFLVACFAFAFVISFRHHLNGFAYAALSLFLAGILANAFDRITRGAVTDWIYLHPGFVLNLADLFIFFGTLAIISFLMLSSRAEKRLSS